jgi:hypothetical protein
MATDAGLRTVAQHEAAFGHRYAMVFAPPADRDEPQ